MGIRMSLLLLSAGFSLLTAQVCAQVGAGAAPPPARTILFVGNSFTHGAYSAVRGYRANSVADLNGDGNGGVPALFKRFTEQAGLDYAVSLETGGGKGLDFHFEERRALIDKPWDVVILQGHSLLDRKQPGNPDLHIRYARQLSALFTAQNPAVDLQLSATWSRPDMVYKPGSPWSGAPIEKMATDLRRASDKARTEAPAIDGIIPIGESWNRAIAAGIADPNPYDGTSFGQINLWAYDHYHGSAFGYYLEALLIFGRITGLDPRSLGPKEKAAFDLGIAPDVAAALQRIASETLEADKRE
jgi:hypothetical protein